MKTLRQLFESAQKKNKEFIRKIYAMGSQNPIGRGVVFMIKDDDGEDALIRLEMVDLPESAHITEITVLEDKGGKGMGDFLMKEITKIADKMKVDLDLNAVPLAHQGKKIPKGKLIKFYKKHGFKSDGGDHMIREYKGKPIKLSGRMRSIDI